MSRLETVIGDRKAELSEINRDITYAKSSLKRLQTEVADAKRELQVTTSNLVDRLRKDLAISGLSEQDICEDFANESCDERQDYRQDYLDGCNGQFCD